MNRRHFTMLSTGTAVSVAGWGRAVADGEEYFTLHRGRGRWWLKAPDQTLFFSLGIPPGDREGRGAEEAIREWRRHYGRDSRAWITLEGSSPLEQGAFNTERTQEQPRGGGGAPYCHLVPFSGARRWNERDRQCDYLHPDWEEWCDHLAREHCLSRAQDRNLIGYFYSDSPCWLQDRPRAEWRGPLFDPAMLTSASGRQELRLLARRYYQVTRDAILRHDPNHLIFGDRFDGSLMLPAEVLEEAQPRVDILSIQVFRDPASALRRWHERTGMPVLLTDAAPLSPEVHSDFDWYASLLRELIEIPGCVGCHLMCQGKGRDGSRLPSDQRVERLLTWRRANRAAARWVARQA